VEDGAADVYLQPGALARHERVGGLHDNEPSRAENGSVSSSSWTAAKRPCRLQTWMGRKRVIVARTIVFSAVNTWRLRNARRVNGRRPAAALLCRVFEESELSIGWFRSAGGYSMDVCTE